MKEVENGCEYMEEVCDLYRSLVKTVKARKLLSAGNITRIEVTNACKILMAEPLGKRRFGTPRRLEDDIHEIGNECGK
jgi:hypothetical protein